MKKTSAILTVLTAVVVTSPMSGVALADVGQGHAGEMSPACDAVDSVHNTPVRGEASSGAVVEDSSGSAGVATDKSVPPAAKNDPASLPKSPAK